MERENMNNQNQENTNVVVNNNVVVNTNIVVTKSVVLFVIKKWDWLVVLNAGVEVCFVVCIAVKICTTVVLILPKREMSGLSDERLVVVGGEKFD